MISIFQKTITPSSYLDLINEFESAKANIAHVDRGNYEIQQRVIDSWGVKIIAYELKSGITEGRALIEREQELSDRLHVFEKLVKHYGELNSAAEELVNSLAEGRINPDFIEEPVNRLEDYSKVLSITKATVANLKSSLEEVLGRKSKLTRAALENAAMRDPLSRDERHVFTAFYEQEQAQKQVAPSALAA